MPRKSSKRELIRVVVERRIKNGEPLDGRSVLAETGGSFGTVLEEIRLACNGNISNNPKKTANQLDMLLQRSELTLNNELRQFVAEITVSSARVMLDDLLGDVQKTVNYSMAKVEHAYMRLMEAADQVKSISRDASIVSETYLKPSSVEDKKIGATEVDILLEHRNRLLIYENAKLIRQKDYLIARLEKYGAEVNIKDLDSL